MCVRVDQHGTVYVVSLTSHCKHQVKLRCLSLTRTFSIHTDLFASLQLSYNHYQIVSFI